MPIKKKWKMPEKFKSYHGNMVHYIEDCNCVDIDYCKTFCSGKKVCARYTLLCRENARNCDLKNFGNINELSIEKG